MEMRVYTQWKVRFMMLARSHMASFGHKAFSLSSAYMRGDNAYYVKRVLEYGIRSGSVRKMFRIWTRPPPGRAAGGGVLVLDTDTHKIFKNTPSKLMSIKYVHHQKTTKVPKAHKIRHGLDTLQKCASFTRARALPCTRAFLS